MTYLLSQIGLCLFAATLIGLGLGWLQAKTSSRKELLRLKSNYQHKIQKLQDKEISLSNRIYELEQETDTYDTKLKNLSEGKLKKIEVEKKTLLQRIGILESGTQERASRVESELKDQIHFLKAEKKQLLERITSLESEGDGESAGSASMHAMSYAIEEVEGIRSEYSRRLREMNIVDTKTLLEVCSVYKKSSQIASELRIEESELQRWVSMCDLMRISGIRGQSAELLELSGIGSVRDLATRTAQTLNIDMSKANMKEGRTKIVPSADTVAQWIAEARREEAKIANS